MKILITGGHFSPAYSIIKELKKRGHEVVIAGRRHPFEGDLSESFEYQICQSENLSFFEIKTGRYQRKFTTYTLISLIRTPAGFIRALFLLRRVRPDVVMTFGGYIGLPIAYAAALLKIPIVLHEQTQKAGLASKQIGMVAAKICISFKSSENYFAKSKIVYSGNPIRSEVFKEDKQIKLPSGKVIYVTGGSAGSHFLNTVMYEIVGSLLKDFIIIHQTGDSLVYKDFEKINSLKERLDDKIKGRYILRKFIFPSEIGSVFSRSDFILSRSGANTVIEIFATKKISLLIPLPYGQENEQLINAKLVANLGVGEYIEEKDATPDVILSKIYSMFKNEKKYKENMGKTEEFVIADAAKRIVDVIEDVSHQL